MLSPQNTLKRQGKKTTNKRTKIPNSKQAKMYTLLIKFQTKNCNIINLLLLDSISFMLGKLEGKSPASVQALSLGPRK